MFGCNPGPYQRIVAVNQRFRELWGLRVQDAHPGISNQTAERHAEDLERAVQASPEGDEDGRGAG